MARGNGPQGWIWFAVLAGGLTALVIWLASEHGGLPESDAGMANIVRGVGFAALLGAGIIHGRRFGFRGAIGAAFAWLAIGAGLMLAYSYRFEATRAWERIAGELVPGAPTRMGERVMAVRRAADGHFYVNAEVNGAAIRFLVDTGASATVLDPRDAVKAGLDPATLSFSQRFRTANGTVMGAPVTIDTVRIGEAEFQGVRASVNAVPLGTSLMGISTLGLFRTWRVEDDRLTFVY